MFKSGRVTFEMKLLLLNVCVVLLVFQDLELKFEISLRFRIYIDRCSKNKMVSKTCGLHVAAVVVQNTNIRPLLLNKCFLSFLSGHLSWRVNGIKATSQIYLTSILLVR